MLASNPELFRLVTQANLETNTSMTMEIFNGTAPDDSIFQDPANYEGPAFDIDVLRTKLNVDNTRLAFISFENTLNANYLSATRFVFPFGDSARELQLEAEGTATWFMLYSANEVDVPINDTSTAAYQVFVGTVGDIGSGADLELPLAEISFSKDLKCSDLIVNLA